VRPAAGVRLTAVFDASRPGEARLLALVEKGGLLLAERHCDAAWILQQRVVYLRAQRWTKGVDKGG